MRRFVVFLVTALGPIVLASAPGPVFEGTPPIKSMGCFAFAPDGTLFIGDAQEAYVYAIDLGDETKNLGKDKLQVSDIDLKLAAMLGTTARELRIHDMAVNPISHNVYLGVTRGSGNDATPVLIRVNAAAKIEIVSLEG